MLNKAAEDSYRKGLACLQADRALEALALFEAALKIDTERSEPPGQARYRSYYGLLLALHGQKTREGIELCRRAAQDEFYNPDMWLNLGRVELQAGDRRKAYNALARGLRLAPGHPELRRYLAYMGIRSRPPFPFLARSNPLNVLVGRITRRAQATS